MNIKMAFSQYYGTYRLIRANESLKDQRHPMFEKNKFMKVLGWFMVLYYAGILVFMGVMLPIGMRGTYCDVAAFHVFDGFFPWVLIVDFWVRFIMQDTPAHRSIPYALLPIRKRFLLNLYLTGNMLSLGNLFWGCMLVPFGLLAVWPIMGIGGCISWWLGWWLMCVASGLFYLFCRTMCSRHLGWILLPILIHGTVISLMTYPDHNPLDMPCTLWMYAFARCDLWPYIVMIAIIISLYAINYPLQLLMTREEIGRKEEVTVRSTTQMDFLNRFGSMGEYLKLEMKMRLRNKQVRLQFFVLLGITMLLCGIQYFTDIYNNSFMTSFICLYAYIVFGGTHLVTIMCYEGNYMDGLMSRKESIYDLLRAKYYFNSIVLFLPFLILLPSVIIGKISIWMNLAYLTFTCGILYAGLFQLAVYNRETISLTTKMTGKQGNTMQQICSFAMIFLPVGLERLGSMTIGETTTYVIMSIMGITGFALHHIWIHQIYERFMKRRHYNMEGFRASRK